MSESLDAIGILEGTDKSSIGHGYLRHYDRILGHLRHEPITMLEIGIFRGASLRSWSRYFDKATIVGIDINPDCRRYAEGRCEVEIGSQADPQFLDALGRKWRPHVIIDDGSHQADHVRLTFRTLFPHLRDGGIFIVEDLHMHVGPWAHTHRGSADITPPDMFLQIGRMVSCPEDITHPDRALAHAIDSVEFFHGGVAMRKKPAPETDPIAARRALVERSDKAEIWASFSMYILSRNGDPDEALQWIRRSIEREPRSAGYQHHLSLILERKGDLAGATRAAQDAVRLHPGFEMFSAHLQALQRKLAQ